MFKKSLLLFRLPPQVWIILAISFVLRLILCAGIGAGFDEAYYYVYSLNPALSYFDHPVGVALLSGFGPLLTGMATPLTIRLASLILFTATSILFFHFARHWQDQRDAVFSTAVFSSTPLFFLGVGAMVLPDCGLAFFWLCTLILFTRIIRCNTPPLSLWIAAGLCSAFAILFKYHGVLLLALFGSFTLLFHRRFFKQAGFYLMFSVAIIAIWPLLFWNAHNEWISFTFQSSRAMGTRFRPAALIQSITGQAAFLSPGMYIAMLYVAAVTVYKTIRYKDKSSAFFCCFGIVPIAIFQAIAFVRPILPHWTLPGYIAVCALAGAFVSRSWHKKWVPIAFSANLAFIVLVLALLFAHYHTGFFQLHRLAERGWISSRDARMDPTLDAYGWPHLAQWCDSVGIPDSTFIFSHKWFLSGQIALAVQGKRDVHCFNSRDARGFALWTDPASLIGRDALFVSTSRYFADPVSLFDEYFESIDPPDSLAIFRGHFPAKTLYFSRCHSLHTAFPLTLR